jgi:hypothetical protein
MFDKTFALSIVASCSSLVLPTDSEFLAAAKPTENVEAKLESNSREATTVCGLLDEAEAEEGPDFLEVTEFLEEEDLTLPRTESRSLFCL